MPFPRRPPLPVLALPALLGGALFLTGCDGGGSPYAAKDAEATEGTGEVPAGAANRALDPGDAGVVGEGNVSDDADPQHTGADEPSGDPFSAKPVTAEEFTALVANAGGKAVLVDCWATWCDPCREAFPHTVALERQFRDQGLKVVTLAFNAPEAQAEVDEFLNGANAGRLTNLLTADGGDTAAWDDLGAQVLPTYVLFGPNGEELARVTGGGSRSEADLDDAVRTALAG